MSIEASKKGTRRAIIAIESVVGVAALVGGFLFIARPNGSLMGMSTSSLSTTPFSDYTVPGILLVVAIGGGTLGAAASVVRRARDAAEIVLISGVMLVLFELVEEALIGYNPQQAAHHIGRTHPCRTVLATRRPHGARGPGCGRWPAGRSLSGASALLAFRKPLEVPLAHVVGAERAREDDAEPWLGFLSSVTGFQVRSPREERGITAGACSGTSATRIAPSRYRSATSATFTWSSTSRTLTERLRPSVRRWPIRAAARPEACTATPRSCHDRKRSCSR